MPGRATLQQGLNARRCAPAAIILLWLAVFEAVALR